jgi:hypothetical protein
MCYDFDAYLAKARMAEWMRMKKPVAHEPETQRDASSPPAPSEPETRDKDREAVAV